MIENISPQLRSLPLDFDGVLEYEQRHQPFVLYITPGTVAKEVGVGNPVEEYDRTGRMRCPTCSAGCQAPSGTIRDNLTRLRG